jgi:hypothetical protein
MAGKFQEKVNAKYAASKEELKARQVCVMLPPGSPPSTLSVTSINSSLESYGVEARVTDIVQPIGLTGQHLVFAYLVLRTQEEAAHIIKAQRKELLFGAFGLANASHPDVRIEKPHDVPDDASAAGSTRYGGSFTAAEDARMEDLDVFFAFDGDGAGGANDDAAALATIAVADDKVAAHPISTYAQALRNPRDSNKGGGRGGGGRGGEPVGGRGGGHGGRGGRGGGGGSDGHGEEERIANLESSMAHLKVLVGALTRKNLELKEALSDSVRNGASAPAVGVPVEPVAPAASAPAVGVPVETVAPAASTPAVGAHVELVAPAANVLAAGAIEADALADSGLTGSAPVTGALLAGAHTGGEPALGKIADDTLVIDTLVPDAPSPSAPDTPGKRVAAPSSTSSINDDMGELAQGVASSGGDGGAESTKKKKKKKKVKQAGQA